MSPPRIHATAAAVLACLISLASPVRAAEGRQDDDLLLQPDDTLCLLGNALAERMQHDGWLETRLQRRLPRHRLSFRNLGFAADELSVQQRTSGFGSWDDHLGRCEANVVLAFFGFVESFAGTPGLDTFRQDLRAFIEHTTRTRYDGEQPARHVLFSSIPFEDLGDPSLPDGREHNAFISAYNLAMAEVALEAGVPLVDLFAPMLARYEQSDAPLTTDGIHLNERGNAELARVIESALVPATAAPPVGDEASMQSLRRLVLEKNLLWFNRYRATDGYNVYGGRAGLSYTDGLTSGGPDESDGITNFEVLQRELTVLDALADNIDRRIWALARADEVDPVEPVPVPALIPVPTNRPGSGPGGAHEFLAGEQAIARMTLPDGLGIKLYASEETFPDLVNPVQMAWDTAGRLWVAVWPTYPHWAPGQPMNDALLVFEDTDGDGRADRRSVFADDLHNPTGFEFWNGGVFVANCPDILFLKDTDGDGRADVRERVLGALSSADTHHSANSFVLGPDGALYFQEGIFHQSQVESIYGPVRNRDGCVWRYEPRTRRVERHIAYGFLNPHGHVFDRWGQDFVTDGTGNVNYYGLPFSGRVEHPAKHRGYFPFFQQRSRPAAATEILSSSLFPEANRGNYLIANVIGFQGIFQYAVRDDGSGFSADEVTPLVHSTDPRFRPADIEVGPDGAVYFLDWHNPLIGHMQHHLRDPSRDRTHGRIYRIAPDDRAPQPPRPIAGRPIPELLTLLREPDDRVRYRARIELSARPRRDVVAAVALAARLDSTATADEHYLLELLWLLQQHDAVDRELLVRVLESPDFRARAAATRVVRGMRRRLEAPLDLLAPMLDDEHPRVRLEAVVALSFWAEPRAAELALRALGHDTDRFLDYAIEATLDTLAPAWSEALASGEPFAADDPGGLAYALSRLETDALINVRPSEPLYLELLTRHDLEAGEHERAVFGLAAERGIRVHAALRAAIERADGRSHGHVDHLLHGLFEVVPGLPDNERAALAPHLARLATEGRRASTRRLATAARVEADGSIEPAWAQALTSLGNLGDLLDAAPLVNDPGLRAALFPRVLPLLDGPPPALAGEAASDGGTRGRYVRIELPGERRTLTLAEVQVLQRGDNIARDGSATQSSVNWGGVPERALDGNTSGVYGDNGQTHTVEDMPNPWWEVDLGSEQVIDQIVLWNRTESDGQWVSRLDGYVVRVLDAGRRTVFRAQADRAPRERAAHDLSDPALRVRRAAVRCLPALDVDDRAALAALAARFADRDVQAAIVAALRSLPLVDWPDDSRTDLGERLLSVFGSRAPEHFDTDTGRELLAFADELAPFLESPRAEQLSAARRRLGPQVVVIRPVPDSLLFDRDVFAVVAGRPVELLFDNVDIMPHNLLLAAPGALAKVGLAAEEMAADPDAWSQAFVPDLPEVLYATGLLQPGDAQTLRFDAPTRPGDYPYVCTVPGHWVRMNGVMRVVDDWDELQADGATPRDRADPADAAATRSFVRQWTLDDFPGAQPLPGGSDEAAAQRGHEVLRAASCSLCHAVDGVGGRTGPELREVAARYDGRELLTHVLEPSRLIAEDYRAELFFTRDGDVLAGRVLAEDATHVTLLDNPYAEDAIRLALDEVEFRRPADVSVMPEGLLSTFERDEILDLLAYLQTLGSGPTSEDGVDER